MLRGIRQTVAWINFRRKPGNKGNKREIVGLYMRKQKVGTGLSAGSYGLSTACHGGKPGGEPEKSGKNWGGRSDEEVPDSCWVGTGEGV